MPIAVIIDPKNRHIPAILKEDTPEELVGAMRRIVTVPESVDCVTAARVWLAGLPHPSGWFETLAEAEAYLQRGAEACEPMSGEELRKIREIMNLSQDAFGRAVGFQDKHVQKQVSSMETGDKPIMEHTARRARELVTVCRLGKFDIH